MAASVKATTNDLIVQETDFRPWGELQGGGSTFLRRLFTWGLPIGPQQTQRQTEKRVEQGGPGEYIAG